MSGPPPHESWWRQDRTLRALLEKFRECEARDQRDVIYALRGISSDAHDSSILDPNYDKSSEQVAQDTTSFMIPEDYKYPRHRFQSCKNWGVSTFDVSHRLLEQRYYYGCDSGWTGGVYQAVNRWKQLEKIIRLLLERCDHWDLEVRDEVRRAPLFMAIQTRKENGAKLLLKKFALDGTDFNPLKFAFEEGNINSIKRLLEAAAQTDPYS